LYASELLFKAYKAQHINPLEDEKCRPLFYLLGHACECCLKASLVCRDSLAETQLIQDYGHDLLLMHKALKGNLAEGMEEIIFWLANSHYINNGPGMKAHDNRYNDYKFDSNECKKRRQALIKKQKENGFEGDKALVIGSVPAEKRPLLEPELSAYSDFLFKSWQGRPNPELAIKSIKEQLRKLVDKQQNV